MSIKLKLDGFDDLLSKIEKAGGTIDGAAKKCLKKSANIMHDELKTQMQAANVDGDLINRMPPPEIESDGNRHTARVGYKKGEYDPDNPSDGYKVVFANYGTPRRSKHGQQPAKRFIEKAKKKANAKIKKAQKETLDEVIGGL
jgi:HK97 gp10 family phage protein